MQFLIASAFLASALTAIPPAPEYKHVPVKNSDPPPPPSPSGGLGNVPRPMKKRYSRAAPAYKPEPPSKQWSLPRDQLINYPANYNPFGKRSASFYDIPDIPADQPKKVKLPPVYQPATYKEEKLPPQPFRRISPIIPGQLP